MSTCRVGLIPVKRERPVFSRRLSSALASTTFDLCSPAKKLHTELTRFQRCSGIKKRGF